MSMSLIDLWNSMGWFARGIVFVMVAMSMASLGISLAKWWRLNRAQKETAKFAPEFSRFLQEEQMEGAIALAGKYKKSHIARVLTGARRSGIALTRSSVPDSGTRGMTVRISDAPWPRIVNARVAIV